MPGWMQELRGTISTRWGIRMFFNCTPYGMAITLDIPESFVYKNHVLVNEEDLEEKPLLVITFKDICYPKEDYVLSIREGRTRVNVIHAYPAWNTRGTAHYKPHHINYKIALINISEEDYNGNH